MIAQMSLIIFVAAIATGIGGKEVGIVVVLLCLWLLLMLFAAITERWVVRQKANQWTADTLSAYLFIAVGGNKEFF